MLPVPPSFRDGNDADPEAPSNSSSSLNTAKANVSANATLRRPPSALESGRRTSAMTSRARSRMEGAAVAGGERPKWR